MSNTNTALRILNNEPHHKSRPLVMGLLSIVAAIAVAFTLVPDQDTLLVGLVIAIPLMMVMRSFESSRTRERKWLQRVLSWFSAVLFMFAATIVVLGLLGVLPAQRQRVERPELPNVPGIQVLRSKRTLDLTNHRQVPHDMRDKKVSRATWNYEQAIIRAVEPQRIYGHRFSTSGLKPDVRCTSHAFTVKDATGPGRINGPQMSQEVDLAVDISQEAIGEEIEVRFEADYWNAFQGETTDWAAARAFYPEEQLVLVVVFPNDKPCTGYRLSSYPNVDGERYEAVTNADVTKSEDGTRIEWRIANPRLNYCYRIDWDW